MDETGRPADGRRRANTLGPHRTRDRFLPSLRNPWPACPACSQAAAVYKAMFEEDGSYPATYQVRDSPACT